MILTKKKFTTSIEELVIEKKLTYIDAIIHFCQENHLEQKKLFPQKTKLLSTSRKKRN